MSYEEVIDNDYNEAIGAEDYPVLEYEIRNRHTGRTAIISTDEGHEGAVRAYVRRGGLDLRRYTTRRITGSVGLSGMFAIFERLPDGIPNGYVDQYRRDIQARRCVLSHTGIEYHVAEVNA